MRPETISTFHPTDPAGKSHPSQTPTSGEPPMLSCPPPLHARTSHSTETALFSPGEPGEGWKEETGGLSERRGKGDCQFVFFILNGCFTPTHGKKLPGAFHCLRDHHSLLLLKTVIGASLVAQWLRICLPMQGTRVRALVREDPACRGAAGPVSHNY